MLRLLLASLLLFLASGTPGIAAGESPPPAEEAVSAAAAWDQIDSWIRYWVARECREYEVAIPELAEEALKKNGLTDFFERLPYLNASDRGQEADWYLLFTRVVKPFYSQNLRPLYDSNYIRGRVKEVPKKDLDALKARIDEFRACEAKVRALFEADLDRAAQIVKLKSELAEVNARRETLYLKYRDLQTLAGPWVNSVEHGKDREPLDKKALVLDAQIGDLSAQRFKAIESFEIKVFTIRIGPGRDAPLIRPLPVPIEVPIDPAPPAPNPEEVKP